MIKRPKATDTEDDILKMQSDFLAEQSKNGTFSPAAKLVKVEQPKSVSKFARKRAQLKASSASISNTDRGDSQPANTFSQNVIIGNIVERSESAHEVEFAEINSDFDSSGGFPRPKRIDKKIKLDPSNNKSIFALTQEKINAKNTVKSHSAKKVDGKLEFGSISNILSGSDADSIHSENVKFLQGHDESQILEEKQRILNTLDPSIVRFLKEKRKLAQITETAKDVDMKEEHSQPESVPNIDLLTDENSKNWLHFDVIEPEKLEWMRDLPKSMPNLKPGEQYEARFDWKGVLLPFTMKDDSVAATSNDLFLHGDDAHRPGYTLQELFRLARSTVIQQRVSAIGSIGGILSIYNQGYYDAVLELPISKMFFLLRYSFDDNTPAMLEVSAKALSVLFYIETDEVLLDMTFDCSFDCLEPTLELQTDCAESDNNNVDLANRLATLDIKATGIQANVNDDDSKLSSMNDFHLAETDLIKCLLRTNILQRISYIFTSINLENSTKISCIKILIRLARTSECIARQILAHTNLVQSLFYQLQCVSGNGDLAALRLQNTTKVFILKFFRIVCSYGEKCIASLSGLGLEAALKTCIFVQENNMTVETVKVQIEALRCARTITLLTKSESLLDELLPALQYTLEWIYQFVNFQDEHHFLFRQCASSVIALLGSRSSMSLLCDKLSLCFSKWFSIASQYGNLELSQVTLLATCLNAIQVPDFFREFLQSYFSKFLESSTYRSMCEALSKSSGFFAAYTHRQQNHKPLPHLHSIVFNSQNSPVFIVSEKPTIYLISSIVRFYNATKYTDTGTWLNDGIKRYIQNFTNCSDWNFSMDWFVRQEITFVLDLLRSPTAQTKLEKTVQINLAYNIVRCLTERQINDVLYLFSHFIFNIDTYVHRMNLTADTLDQWKSIFGKVCVEHFLNTNALSPENSLRENFHRVPMLSKDWPCMLLLKMFKTPDTLRDLRLPEKEVVTASIKFMTLQNVNHIKILSPTEQFLYTMIAFLGKDNTFLDPDVNKMLAEFVEITFKDQQLLNFDNDFDGRFNFENLYISFLDHFQGVSYGDVTFSKLVLAPLAQRHNIKWRNMIWSEHLHVLRFITCTENDLIGDLKDYLEPPEVDVALLKCYYQAINSSILLSNSVPYKIATHHLNKHKATIVPKKSLEAN